MKHKSNRIIVSPGTGKKLAKIFGVSNAMVSKALTGRGTSELCKKIRYTAISQYGGEEYARVEESL